MILIKIWSNIKKSSIIRFLFGIGLVGSFSFLGGALFGIGLAGLNLQYYIGVVGLWFFVIFGLSVSGILTYFVFEYLWQICIVGGNLIDMKKVYSKYLEEQKEKNYRGD